MTAPAEPQPVLVPAHYVLLVEHLAREFGGIADALASVLEAPAHSDEQQSIAAFERLLETVMASAQTFADVCNGTLGRAFTEGAHLAEGDARSIARTACEPAMLLAQGIAAFQASKCTARYRDAQPLLLAAAQEVLSGMLTFEQGLVRLIRNPESARTQVEAGAITLEYRPQPGPALRRFSQWLAAESAAAEAMRGSMSAGKAGGALTNLLLLATLGFWLGS